jgi:hypothetical protein
MNNSPRNKANDDLMTARRDAVASGLTATPSAQHTAPPNELLTLRAYHEDP